MLTDEQLDAIRKRVVDQISNRAAEDPAQMLSAIRRQTIYLTDLTPGCVKTTKDILVSELLVTAFESKPALSVGSQKWTDRWLNLAALETEIREGTKKCEDSKSLSVMQDSSVIEAAQEMFLRALWLSLETAHNRTKREPTRHGTSMEELWASPISRTPYATVEIPFSQEPEGEL